MNHLLQPLKYLPFGKSFSMAPAKGQEFSVFEQSPGTS